MREGLRDALDRLDAHAALVGGALDVDRGDGLAEPAIRHSLVDHHAQDREREQPFCSGGIADPFVRVRRRQRLTRLDVDERAGAAVAERVHAREGPGVVHVREPGLDEVGAERQDGLGVLERVVRDRVAIERDLVGGADRLVGEGLQGDPGTRPERLHPAVEQATEVSVLELRDDGDRPALAAGPERGDLVRDDLRRGVPRGGLESGAAFANHRSGDPVGMIETLERGLAPHAERARVDRMVRVSLELDDAPLAIARDDAAAGRALPAHGREPRGDARHELLVRHHQRKNGLAGLLASAARGGRAGHRDDLEEVASVHLPSAPAPIRPKVASDRHAWLRFIDGLSPDSTEGGE